MPEEFQLSYLGGARLTRGDEPLTGPISRKAQALLCYLAVTAHPQPREALLGLLWGDQPEATAQTNLRQTLARLRKRVGPLLRVDRTNVAINPDVPHRVDVTRFETEVQRAIATNPTDLEGLRAALARYAGDFLAGFDVPEATAFEEWAAGQRERLRQLALRGLETLAAALADRADDAAAIDALRRLLALDPWHEEAHRQLMTLLALGGRRGAALAQYDACRRILREELGVEPEAETTALYDRIRTGPIARARRDDASVLPSARPANPARQNRPPAPLTSFVGREEELAQIAASLSDPACRLLTLTGPGGVGKTRLALRAAADQADAFPDGVAFVPLMATTTADLVAPAIARAVGVAFAGPDDPTTQLVRALRNRHLLLVLDGVEHLLEATDVLLAILDGAPRVKALATSRQRLAAQAEWLLKVEGLPLPAAEDEASAATSSAVRLFVERARQVRTRFALTAATAGDIVRICRLVDGRPLGIELAAAWVRSYSCREIVEEMERSLDFLTTSLRDVPPHHRSLRVVVDRSWELLTPRQQVLLRQFSVFRGGFTREAARAVTGASPADLADLEDKSLLHRAPAGRYGLHEVVRQYAVERLGAQTHEHDATRRRHASYYAAFLQEREIGLRGPRHGEVLSAIEAEIDNVRAAWEWAVSARQEDAIEQALDGLARFYELRGRLQEGEAATANAVAALDGADTPAAALPRDRRLLLGRLLGWQGRFAHFLGRSTAVETLLERSVELLRPLRADRELAFSLHNLARQVDVGGRYEPARRLDEEALAHFRAAGDRHGIHLTLNHLGTLAFCGGDFAAARRHWEESGVLSQEVGDHATQAYNLCNLGEVALSMGDYAEARDRVDRALAVLHEHGGGWWITQPLEILGILAWAEGDYEAARRLQGQRLDIAREVGDRRRVAHTLIKLAQVDLAAGDLASADARLSEGLPMLPEIGYQRGLALGLATVGELALRRGSYEAARRHWQESLATARRLDDRHAIGVALGGLGHAAAFLGDEAAARRSLAASVDILVEIGALPSASQVVVATAETLVCVSTEPPIGVNRSERLHRQELAISLLAFALHQPATWHHVRERARALHDGLAACLTTNAVSAAEERGRALATRDLPALCTFHCLPRWRAGGLTGASPCPA